MGVCKRELPRGVGIRSPGGSGGPAAEGFQSVGSRQQGMGICNSEHRDEKLFAILARASERRLLSEFNGQGLVNTGWAFTTVDIYWMLAVQGIGERGRAVGERVQWTGASQHGMGICDGAPVGRKAVRGTSERWSGG